MDTIIINQDSKIPLYLQLKNQIRDYISSGQALEEEQLPPVNSFAAKLGIHFETVRKAYKDLENDGFITMKRGLGTFVSFKTSNPKAENSTAEFENFIGEAKNLIRRSLRAGKYTNQLLADFQTALAEVSVEFYRQKVIFTECSNYQTEEITDLLKQSLNRSFAPNRYIEVEGVLVKDLKDFLARENDSNVKTNIVTTGFHFDEIRNIVGTLPINIYVLITNMSRETRQKLAHYDQKTKYAFISQTQHIATVIMDILKDELGDVKIEYCSIEDRQQLPGLIKRVDVILAAPSVYTDVAALAPPNLPIFGVFDSVDTMSLKLLNDQIFTN